MGIKQTERVLETLTRLKFVKQATDVAANWNVDQIYVLITGMAATDTRVMVFLHQDGSFTISDLNRPRTRVASRPLTIENFVKRSLAEAEALAKSQAVGQ